MAKVHAERYEQMPNAKVVAVAARDSPLSFVERYATGATPYADATKMFDDADLDAVDICTPTDTHADLVTAAADRGLDVCCEKPVERTLADAEALADAVTDAGITCLIGHVVRFFPEYETARRRVEEGAIGDVGNIRTFRQTPTADLGDWFRDHDRSGGVILDLAIHEFDFLRWLCGDIERAFTRRQSRNGSEYSLTTLRFSNGAVGHVDGRWSIRDDAPFYSKFEIAGDDGLIEYDSRDTIPVEIQCASESDAHRDLDVSPLAQDPYRRQLDHFVECLESGIEPEVGVDDAINSLRVALAALESVESGRPVAPADLSA